MHFLQVLDIALAVLAGSLLAIITSFNLYAVWHLPRRITICALAMVDKHLSQGPVILTLLWHLGASVLAVAMGLDLISYVLQAHCLIFVIERAIVMSNYLGIRTRAHKAFAVYKTEVLQGAASA